MITRQELKTLSLDFRRISSNLLTADYKNAEVALKRLYSFMEKSEWIHALLAPIFESSDFIFRDCFPSRNSDRSNFKIPEDEHDHVKAQYEYMCYILETDNVSILGEAMNYSAKNNINECVRHFLNDAFKPLIDFVNDAISKEMILVEEENKMVTTINIGTNYGTANVQGSGSITSTNTNNISTDTIAPLLEKVMASLDSIKDVPADEVDSVRDDLESIQEQISAEQPKKNRMQKALAGVKKFASDFSMKLAVSVAATAVTHADWTTLIQQVETFIAAH